MHPILFRIGSFELGTYGLLMALGFFAALGLILRLARRDGLPGEALSDLTVAVLIGGILGSKLLMIAVDLIHGRSLAQLFDLATLRAGGAMHGGIILGTAVFFWRIRKHKLPLALTMDAISPAVALGQAIGRLGCLAAGCCYGTECHAPWAITFTRPEAELISGTPLLQALHPVQIYTFLAEMAIVGILLLLGKKRRFAGQISAVFFVMEGLSRVILEIWRGDLDRGVWLGLSWLSTGRLTGFAFILFGVGLGWWFRRQKALAV
jgi:phosphatidylglycerol:prolipoprotein diacylglycerol transferase